MISLLFLPRGSALVQNFEKLEVGRKQFLGRKYIQIEPPKTSDPEDAGVWAFVPTGDPETVPYRAEYVKACRDGDLWAADEATARACGVKFDSKFGAPEMPADAHDTEWPSHVDASA